MEDMIDEGSALTTKWVKGELLDELSDPAVDPKGLLGREGQPRPFDRLDWFKRVLAHEQDVVWPFIAHGWIGGQHGWLFLKQQDAAKSGGLSNWYSMAFRPVFGGDLGEGQKLVLLRALAKRMARSRRVTPLLELAPVPVADGTSALIKQAFEKGGWTCLRHESSTSWTANVAGMTFEDYWAARPGQLRSTYQRKLKKSDFQIEILTKFDEAAWADYQSVYADSWKTTEGSAAFLSETAAFESKAGCFRMGIARLEGQAVAAQFWTVDQGVAYIHKLAHREEVKEMSPGTILSAALFRHVIDVDKVAVIDFGTGNDGFKADWMDRSEPLHTIRLFKKLSLRGQIGAWRARISALVHRTPLD
jgi:Acetyltransferase (GNAT) domain